MLSMLGLTSIRSLMVGWAVSGVLLVVGLVLVLTGHAGVGFILFIVGAIGSVVVTWGMLRLRSAASRERRPE
jgi:bacteriorhodopsin